MRTRDPKILDYLRIRHQRSDEQTSLLSRRGLIIDSEKNLAEWLECVSYYRLRGYTHPFQKPNDDHRRSSLV